MSSLVASIRSRLGSVARQFTFLVVVSVLPVLVALAVFGWLMVISGDAAVEIAAIVVAVGALTGLGARWFARGVAGDIEAIHYGLAEVAGGARSTRIVTSADDELSELAATVNSMTATLAAAERSRERSELARRDLIAAVSHDLRTPITSLRLLADAIGDEIVDGEQRQAYLRRLSTHVAALSELIDDLFELSRLDAGDRGWALRPVSLAPIVHDAVEAMRVAADAQAVEVRTETPDAPLVVAADPERIQRVLFNLIENAIRFTPAGGRIVVVAEAVPGGVEVEVSDTGPGIDPDDREQVFATFFRGGAQAARTGTGSGLGLAIARAVVEAHGGRIWLADAGAGTRVRFALPAAGD